MRKIALYLALALTLTSCHGRSDDQEVSVVLTPTKTTITADGIDNVEFTVLYGAADVTAEAQIYLASHSEMAWSGRKFATEQVGEYTFQAIYRDQPSEAVTIVATAPEGPIQSRFERHICVMDMTGTWCTFCPEGMTKLLFFAERGQWKDIVHIIALHDNKQGDDPMGLSLTNTIMDDLGLVDFPSFLTDLREGGSLTTDVSKVVPSFESSLEDFPAHCGVKISSSVAGGVANVEVDLFAESEDQYAVTVLLLEDNIIAPQKDGSVIHEEYSHKHVVRTMLNSNYKGDSLGTLVAESVGSKSYTYTLDEEWKVEDMSIVALAIDGTGYVNNVASCKLGESCDYNYLDAAE